MYETREKTVHARGRVAGMAIPEAEREAVLRRVIEELERG
jgi:hypothetical protein